MILRLFSIEAAGLRRSPLLWVTTLLVAGGSILGRTVSWVMHAIERSDLAELLAFVGDAGWANVATPLALLAYLIAAAYLFGSEFDDGSIDLILTSPVRRESVVLARTALLATWVLGLALLGWIADFGMRALLSTTQFDPGPVVSASAALVSAVAAFATLSVVTWVAVRFRGALPALGLGIGIQVVVLTLGGIAGVRTLPWFLPLSAAVGAHVSWWSVAMAATLFAAGFLATVFSLRNADIYE